MCFFAHFAVSHVLFVSTYHCYAVAAVPHMQSHALATTLTEVPSIFSQTREAQSYSCVTHKTVIPENSLAIFTQHCTHSKQLHETGDLLDQGHFLLGCSTRNITTPEEKLQLKRPASCSNQHCSRQHQTGNNQTQCPMLHA